MSSIATRGLMFSNTHRVGSSSSVGGASKGGGWRPLHKPQWFEVNKKVTQYWAALLENKGWSYGSTLTSHLCVLGFDSWTRPNITC